MVSCLMSIVGSLGYGQDRFGAYLFVSLKLRHQSGDLRLQLVPAIPPLDALNRDRWSSILGFGLVSSVAIPCPLMRDPRATSANRFALS